MLVSVCIRTYNQKQYIKDCLEGALMQKTTFDYEVIVSDDGSDDGSIDILLAYKEKYSSIIRIIEGGHLGGTANLKRVIEASDAKYIALCDGDDYWTDAYKLQKQVDF